MPPTCANPCTSTAWPANPIRSSTLPARAGQVGDSVTTDHISPAASIRADFRAGKYLSEHGIERKDFNSDGSRRGNHEVVIGGTFANIRLRNQLAPDTEGGWTREFSQPGGPVTTIYDASVNYGAAGTPLVLLGRQGIRLGLIAGLGRQGHRTAGCARGDRRVVGADPPLKPASVWVFCRCS